MHRFRLALAIMWLTAACEDSAPAPITKPDDGVDAATSDAGDRHEAGTRDGERTYVTIRFEARVGDEPFACDRTYRGVGTSSVEVEPRDLRVFVQDLALVRAEDGVEVPVALDEREGVQRTDVTLLDFENDQGSCVGVGGTPATNTIVTGWVPADKYDGVAFTNGVPEEVNHQNPIDLTAPLVAGPLHWNWNGGFLFFNAQLRAVSGDAPSPEPADNDGGESADAGSSQDQAQGAAIVHIGSTLCSPNQGCGKPNRNRVHLPDFDLATQRIVLDLAALFADVDLRESTTCHAVGVECGVFFPPLGIDYESGRAAKTQTMYHVE
jgi:uncharacterized repeat protein (TIGR04052 family)